MRKKHVSTSRLQPRPLLARKRRSPRRPMASLFRQVTTRNSHRYRCGDRNVLVGRVARVRELLDRFAKAHTTHPGASGGIVRGANKRTILILSDRGAIDSTRDAAA
jgi:hypothetical protein